MNENEEVTEADEENDLSDNRFFLILVSVLGGLILLVLIFLMGFLVFYLPNRNASVSATNALIAATYTQEALDQAETATALIFPISLSSETPTLESSSTPVIMFATDTPTVEPERYYSTGEESGSKINPDRLRVGQLEFEYPANILVNSSETVLLRVSLPYELASQDVTEFQRIPLPIDNPETLGFSSYITRTMLYDAMRAKLTSPGLRVESIQGDILQRVHLDEQGVPTNWEWVIQAPNYAGKQVMVLSVYLGASVQPSWVGSFDINVVMPTDTPAPTETNTLVPPIPTFTLSPTITPSPTLTPTSIPVVKKVVKQIVDTIDAKVCIGIPAALAALFGVFKLVSEWQKSRNQVVNAGNDEPKKGKSGKGPKKGA
jgi:hypothetical protein